jgi:hypothetical protein
MRLTLSRGEVERLHEEIGDISKTFVGPKLLELYRYLDDVLALEWDERKFMKQQRGGGRTPRRTAR